MRDLMRSRWAALGAAVAVTLGAGGVSLTQAALDSGDKPVFVSITPCRLLDTRPGDVNVGGRTTPLGAGESIAVAVTGSSGECSGIPADAAGAAMNVTAIAGTEQSYLTIFPADAAQPNASNLNWRAGDGPTPNKVDVKLSSTGAVNVFNAFGTVHIAVDLVGYYVDHTHDDRYYTEAELDTALAGKADTGDLAGKADASDVYTTDQVDTALAGKADSTDVYTRGQVDTALAGKANSSDVYTTAEVDALIAGAGSFARVIVVAGDGSATANADALAAAITTASAATAADPWLIFLEPGVYDVGADVLTIPDHVTLQGSGPRATKITGTANEYLGTGAESVISDLWIDQASTSTTNASALLVDDDGVVVRNIYGTSAGDTVIEVAGASGVLIDSVEIDAADFAIDVGTGVVGLVVRDSILRSSTFNVYDGGIASDSTIEHSYLVTTSPGGYEVLNIPSGSVTIRHSTLVSETGGSVQSIVNTDAELFMHQVHVDVAEAFGTVFTMGTATCTALSTPSTVSDTTCI